MSNKLDEKFLAALDARSLSPDERCRIQYLWSDIENIDQHVRKFDCVLRLYRYARQENHARIDSANERRNEIAAIGCGAPEAGELLARCQTLEDESMMYRSWAHTAARDGAMTIYHLCYLMAVTWSKMALCDLLDQIQVAANKELADNLFQQAFPAFAAIRSALVHLVENSATPLHYDNSLGAIDYPEPDMARSLFFAGTLEGDTFQATYENRIHGYDLYEDSLVALRNSIGLIRISLIRGGKP